MTTKKNPFSADFLAGLEGDAVVMAGSPRAMRRRSHVGNQSVAVSSVRNVVLEALLSAGYDHDLAEKMAEEVADQVPAIESKLSSAA